jgi:hypothetical protein
MGMVDIMEATTAAMVVAFMNTEIMEAMSTGTSMGKAAGIMSVGSSIAALPSKWLLACASRTDG